MSYLDNHDFEKPMSPEEFANLKDLRRSQKQRNWSLAGLSLVSVAILVMWFLQFQQNITAPLYRNIGITSNQDLLANSNMTTLSQDRDELLKLMDSDGDGLSDYDELYIYGTSPFLEDTDGDGIPDGVEIAQGTDPLCPTGQICTGSLDLDLDNDLIDNNTPDYLDLDSQFDNSLFENPEELVMEMILSNSSGGSADTLRQILIEAGMEKEMVDLFSDEDLLETFKEVFNQ